MRLRLAELIAALSLATDLGLGMPQEHVLCQCRIALGLADRVGVDDAERAAVYYTAMLAWVGCTADSHELAAQFGDEIEFRAAAHEVDLAGLPMMSFLLGRVGAGRPPLRRARMAAKVATTRGRVAAEAMTAHCQVASQIARRLGLGPEVQEPLVHVFARWDGKGIPRGTGGGEVPLAIRLVQIAAIAEVHHRSDGVDAAAAVLDLGDGSDMYQPDRQRQLLSPGPARDPFPVPAREDVHEWLLDLGAEPKAPRDLRGDLAVRRNRFGGDAAPSRHQLRRHPLPLRC